MQDDSQQKGSDHKKRVSEDGVPLLEDIVISSTNLPDIELDKENIDLLTPPIDSEIAGIEEDIDDLALTKMVGDDSYSYYDEDEIDTVSSGLAMPQHDVVIATIRSALQQRLAKEMSDLIAPVLEQTIQQFSQQIRHEVSASMETRIDELIQQELDNHFRSENEEHQ